MSELSTKALTALAQPGLPVARAAASVPPEPGLYAVTGSPVVWGQLGLGQPPDDRPLYVGKAEKSLASRDVRTHFATGKTGSSTLRRALAGLLADQLDLHAQPRNPAKPAHFANYGLAPESDARLTSWMLEDLGLVVWASPPGAVLTDVERDVLVSLAPPLNLDKVVTPWRRQVKWARARLAAEARAWTPEPREREADRLSRRDGDSY